MVVRGRRWWRGWRWAEWSLWSLPGEGWNWRDGGEVSGEEVGLEGLIEEGEEGGVEVELRCGLKSFVPCALHRWDAARSRRCV